MSLLAFFRGHLGNLLFNTIDQRWPVFFEAVGSLSVFDDPFKVCFPLVARPYFYRVSSHSHQDLARSRRGKGDDRCSSKCLPSGPSFCRVESSRHDWSILPPDPHPLPRPWIRGDNRISGDAGGTPAQSGTAVHNDCMASLPAYGNRVGVSC